MISPAKPRRKEAFETLAWMVTVLTVATAVQLFFVSRGLFSISWDGSARTVVAYRWMLDKHLLRPATWLPFQPFVVGLTLQFWRDLLIAPRMVSFIFGLVSVGSVMWLSRELFADRRSTILSAVLAAFFAQRLVLAVVPLSSIIFSAIAVSGLALAARWLSTGRPVTLCLASLVLGLSGTVRYEGWVLSGVFLVVASGVVLWHRRWRETPYLVIAAALVAAFPLFWITLHAIETGHLLGFLGPGSTPYPLKTAFLKNPLTQFINHGFLTGNLVGVASLAVLAWRDVRYRLFAAITFLPLAIVSGALLVSSKAQSGPSWRMVCVWGLALVPFTADAINRLLESRHTARRVVGGALAVLMVLASLGLVERIRRRSEWVFPQTDREVGAFLSEYLERESGARILIESRRSWFLNVLVASQRPELFVKNEGLPGLDRPVVLSPNELWKGSRAEHLGIRVLVFRSPDHTRSLGEDPDLRCLGEFGPWRVYEVAGSPGSKL